MSLTELVDDMRQQAEKGGGAAGKEKLAYICSPYRGNMLARIGNILYARELTKRALRMGLCPITPHLYLTQVLDDRIPGERSQGTAAGLSILSHCGVIVIGTRRGISDGMYAEIAEAKKRNDINFIWEP